MCIFILYLLLRKSTLHYQKAFGHIQFSRTRAWTFTTHVYAGISGIEATLALRRFSATRDVYRKSELVSQYTVTGRRSIVVGKWRRRKTNGGW